MSIIIKVNPIVIYPKCMEENGVQSDCRTCPEKLNCKSPRSMCTNPYPKHPNGCPNYGKLDTCPPKNPAMYDQIFHLDDVYAVVTVFDLYSYYDQRRKRRPDLPEGQIRNKLNWQGKDKKLNDLAAAEFYKMYPDKLDYVVTRLLECMGVNVIDTLGNVGIPIIFPVEEITRRVAFIAKVIDGALDKYDYEIYEDKNKHIKTLRRKQKK